MLNTMIPGKDIEDCEIMKHRFDGFDREMNANASRVAVVNQLARQLLHVDHPGSEEIIENQTDDVTAVVAASDNQTALLARQIRDKVSRAFEGFELKFRNIQIAKQKLLQTAKILCNVLEEPVKTYMR